MKESQSKKKVLKMLVEGEGSKYEQVRKERDMKEDQGEIAHNVAERERELANSIYTLVAILTPLYNSFLKQRKKFGQKNSNDSLT